MKILNANQKATVAMLEKSHRPLTYREIAEAMARPLSSVRTAVNTLVYHGCLRVAGEPERSRFTFETVGEKTQ